MRRVKLNELAKQVPTPDKTQQFLNMITEDVLRKTVEDSVKRYLIRVGSTKKVQTWIRKHWLEPYQKFFVKIWVETTSDTIDRIQEILTMALVSRSLYQAIPFSIQQGLKEARDKYKRFREEMRRAIHLASATFFSLYPQNIERNVTPRINNLDTIIFTKELLKRRA